MVANILNQLIKKVDANSRGWQHKFSEEVINIYKNFFIEFGLKILVNRRMRTLLWVRIEKISEEWQGVDKFKYNFDIYGNAATEKVSEFVLLLMASSFVIVTRIKEQKNRKVYIGESSIFHDTSKYKKKSLTAIGNQKNDRQLINRASHLQFKKFIKEIKIMI